MIFDAFNSALFWNIIHLFGVALGAGGAFISDGMFFASIKDRSLSEGEVKFLRMGALFVWTGLVLLIISGLGLFFGDPHKYLTSSKFMTKMSIVAIIFLNGVYFHWSHIPFLELRKDVHFKNIPELARKRTSLMISGVISVISWSLAIILGALRTIPYSFTEGLAAYLIVIMGGIGISYILRERIIPLS